SHTVTDFSGNDNWTPVRSIVTCDPAVNEPNVGIYAHDFETYVPTGNNKYIWYIQGPYMGVQNYGTGHTETIGGSLSIATSSGDVSYQIGSASLSFGRAAATIAHNEGLEVATGHDGSGGGIKDDFGIYMFTPDHSSPITNHYGIYLEDQAVGVGESYAIYSA